MHTHASSSRLARVSSFVESLNGPCDGLPVRSAAVALLFSACLVSVLMLSAGSASAERSVISPDLRTALESAGENEHIPVILVFREQLDIHALLPAARSLNRTERRSFAKTELRDHASRLQSDVRARIAQGELDGEVSRVRPLWIANGILAELAPTLIEELGMRSELRTILWDPPIPDEEANDEGERIPEGSPGHVLDGGEGARGTELWQLENIGAPEAWALGYEGQGVVVSVQDNGVYGVHPDIDLWNNAGEIAGNGIDDDNNGYVDDTWGWDFQSGDNDPSPAGDDHGTRCAGIVGGDGTNGTRTGVAPQALIMACKVSSWGQNIEGIEYAIDNGAHVITMSRSQKWRFNPKPDYDWWRAITDGELLTGIFHANSIGNEGDNVDTDPIPFNIAAPGCCPTPYVHPDQVQAGISGITAGCGAHGEDDSIDYYSSIGPFAWEDIEANWPVYPFEMRPEYQDYPWFGGLPGLLKPDVCAPGLGTTSIASGGGYGTFSGTSSATPHVAGCMALILSANPNLTPEEMAMILQTTATDLGDPGKDVYYGAGKINCLAGVQAAVLLDDSGELRGVVTDSDTGFGIENVLVEAIDTAYSASTDASGNYSLRLPEGEYTIQLSNFFYAEESWPLVITLGEVVDQNFELDRLPGAAITGHVTRASTPFRISGAEVIVADAPIDPLTTSIDGSYATEALPADSYDVTASKFGYAPLSKAGDVVEGANLVLDFDLSPSLIALNMEADPDWVAGIPGDDATTGVWERVDPNGTAAQPENDHTQDPGTHCWVTGQGSPGGGLGENDVDNGTTTLQTSAFDLSGFQESRISYWAWFSNDLGTDADDEWVVQISNDGGDSWVDLIRTSEARAFWENHEHRVADLVTPSAEMVVRFVASDLGAGSIVEAAVDDFQVFGGNEPVDVPLEPATLRNRLSQSSPNPFADEATIRFQLAETGTATLRVYDVNGRHVRTLRASSQPLDAGFHSLSWDGRDESGQLVGSGVYYYRLAAGASVLTRQLVLAR